MRKSHFTFVYFVAVQCTLQMSFCDWNPIVYNAIKWTSKDQGQSTIAYTTNHGIDRVPMAYHGGVDINASGEISDKNIERFTNWVHQRIPSDYCGPIVLDYECPWWGELGARSILPKRLHEILSVYIEGVHVANSVLPNAQWGYWGIPLMRNTSKQWLSQGVSLEPLISQSKALYPVLYDSNRGNETPKQTQQFIETVLQQAGGRMPVYAFVSPRFTGEGGDHSYFVPDDVFLRRINAAMRSVWVDDEGIQHKIQGLILWDTYGHSPKSEWAQLDLQHTHYFEMLEALVQAWKDAMDEVQVLVELRTQEPCQRGLPEPTNSGAAIDDLPILQGDADQRVVHPKMEDDRIPSGRIPGDRISE